LKSFAEGTSEKKRKKKKRKQRKKKRTGAYLSTKNAMNRMHDLPTCVLNLMFIFSI
jgi:hypothetical protein